MQDQFCRTEMLIGKENINKIKKSKVAIFGLGGVGSYVLEALARAGVQNFILVDADKIDITNINRQILATKKTIGEYKVDVARKRVLEINEKAIVKTYNEFFTESSKDIIEKDVNYIADCIDTVKSKIELVVRAKELCIPIISSMGTGNKLDPTKFEVTDIYKTQICPLAKVMRKELKKRSVESLKVVYSKEEPIKINKDNIKDNENKENKKIVPGSISFVPSSAGLIMAGEIIKDIINL